ncbi:MAG: hypothetical protein SWK76_09970 [Actinomycetota bacterium]|nr:hypothetical protein [Actinomycetota bacterium]
MKALLVVLDGLADISQPDLGGVTPLRAAPTPRLDRLASEGCCALMYTVPPGICPSSEVAHWRMFGYKLEDFPGRSYLHALAAGLPCEAGDALFMFNLMPVRESRRGVFIEEGSPRPTHDACRRWVERFQALVPEGLRLYHLGGVEFVAVVRSGSHHVRPTDPFLHNLPLERLRAVEGWEGDRVTSETLEALGVFLDEAAELLGEPGEEPWGRLGISMKWPSRAGGAEPFERRHGLKAAAIVSTLCFEGMGELLSMRVEVVEKGGAEEELREKLRRALAVFREGWDFAFVHVKHADEAAHTGDPLAKKDTIASLDRAFDVIEETIAGGDLLTVVTADHTTPTTSDPRVIHGGDPVPVLFSAPTVRRDAVRIFDEVEAASGGMGQLEAGDLVPLVLYLSRRARFFTGP